MFNELSKLELAILINALSDYSVHLRTNNKGEIVKKETFYDSNEFSRGRKNNYEATKCMLAEAKHALI